MQAAPARLWAALLACLVVAACQPEGEPAPSPSPPEATEAGAEQRVATRSGGTLRYGLSEPAAIVPIDAVSPDELVVVDTLFDSLTAWSPSLAVVPAAATSWQADDSATTWTFTLREEATFHDEDATPVTAADFKFAWEQAVTDGAAGFHLRQVEGYEELVAGRATELAGVEAVDEHTLRVRLSSPHAQFPTIVAHPALGPLPRRLWDSDAARLREQPVGNGPFEAVGAWARGQFLRVRRFDDWRNGARPARLDEVLFQFMDSDTAFVAFQQDRLQVSPLPEGAVDGAVREFAGSADGYRGPGVLHGDTPVVYFLGFNVTVPPFDDPHVRRAVSLAIDRQAIASEVLGGNASPADALVSPAFPEGRAGSCGACIHDPRQAAAIFVERGVGPLTLSFNSEGGHRGVAERVRDDLHAAGAGPVTLEELPFDDYGERVRAGEAALFRYGWQPEYPTADNVLYPLFHSSQAGQGNLMGYAASDVDALLDEARETLRPARRAMLYRRAEALVVDRDQVVVPILFFRHQRVVSDRVSGFVLNPMGLPNLEQVHLRPPE